MSTNTNIRKRTNDIPFMQFAISLAVSSILSIVILLVVCAVIFQTKDPAAYAGFAGYFTLFLSAFAGSIITGKLTDSAAVGGLICALWFVLVSALITLIIGNNTNSFLSSLLIRSALLPIGALGGLISKKRSRNQKKKRKPKMMYKR